MKMSNNIFHTQWTFHEGMIYENYKTIHCTRKAQEHCDNGQTEFACKHDQWVYAMA